MWSLAQVPPDPGADLLDSDRGMDRDGLGVLLEFDGVWYPLLNGPAYALKRANTRIAEVTEDRRRATPAATIWSYMWRRTSCELGSALVAADG